MRHLKENSLMFRQRFGSVVFKINIVLTCWLCDYLIIWIILLTYLLCRADKKPKSQNNLYSVDWHTIFFSFFVAVFTQTDIQINMCAVFLLLFCFYYESPTVVRPLLGIWFLDYRPSIFYKWNRSKVNVVENDKIVALVKVHLVTR